MRRAPHLPEQLPVRHDLAGVGDEHLEQPVLLGRQAHFRALHPLLTLIDQRRTRDFIETFLAQYEQGGRLPVWELAANETDTMIGYHAVPVIADEGCTSAKDAYELFADTSVHGVNVKLMKSGIAESLEIISIAKAAGKKVHITD